MLSDTEIKNRTSAKVDERTDSALNSGITRDSQNCVGVLLLKLVASIRGSCNWLSVSQFTLCKSQWECFT